MEKKIIAGLPQIKPMVISVWCGESKPTDLSDYLQLFVSELDYLLSNNMYINGKQIIILFRCFICDTPARSFIKAIVGHTSKVGCQKCMAEGTYYNDSHRLSFHRIPISEIERQQELRTDERFRNRFQAQHHKGDTILEQLPIDMIKGFPTSDSLHLLDLGVMKG